MQVQYNKIETPEHKIVLNLTNEELYRLRQILCPPCGKDTHEKAIEFGEHLYHELGLLNARPQWY